MNPGLQNIPTRTKSNSVFILDHNMGKIISLFIARIFPLKIITPQETSELFNICPL
jgi:hypothetical protein